MKWCKWLLTATVLLLSVIALLIYLSLSLSLPQYEGEQASAVSQTVRVERDALGYLSVHAANRNDAAYALGFAHAQERFFQMDVLRRNAAGELSALFGERALATDKARRQHRFSQRAKQSYAQLTAAQQSVLQRYTAGVNAGLQALSLPPFEYSLLRQTPQRWQDSDAFLVIYSMYLDLQGKLGRDDYAMSVLKQTVPADWYQFLQQDSDRWQAALDGSTLDNVAMPDSAYPQVLRQQHLACQACRPKDSTDIGSNNFALSGALTTHGGAILADDMHLGARVPGTWFKAQLNWREHDKLHTVSGLTLPGTPAIVVGANGHIAWGFTNSTGDWHDLVALKLSDDGKRYLTPEGWQAFSYHYETIEVADGADETIELTETIWGPLVRFGDSPPYALRWVAYDEGAVNFNLMQLEHATTVEDALAIAPHAGIPTQNLLVADSKGHIGWSLMGILPRRTLADFDVPQDWSDASQLWQGNIDSAQQPRITGVDRLWTANARMIGGDAYALIGNGGYDLGARGWQIK
ncbi:MAG: penicillin acylase family protein, partial [Rheinheimera sp.]|nr:penicillin acylase family protein [Rheinheimera sp.]